MRVETVFGNLGEIPNIYSCDGDNVNPEISIEDMPEGTQTIAIIVEDPDAKEVTGKVWVHWLVWNIYPNEDVIKIAKNSKIGIPGKNDAGKLGYDGPCPPGGRQHHYYFYIYALDSPINLQSGATKPELEEAMKGHVLDKVELVGVYNKGDVDMTADIT